MTKLPFAPSARGRLLGGISTALLATILLPVAAEAQTRQVDSSGNITLVTTQRSQDSAVSAESIVSLDTVHANTITGAEIIASGNVHSASATDNAATSLLEGEAANGPSGSSRGLITGDAISANGPILIVARQTRQRAPVSAEVSGPTIGLVTGAIERSNISITANKSAADARGNEHIANLPNSGGGAILLSQISDTSRVHAGQSGMASLVAASVSASALSLAGNQQMALAETNSGTATLVVTGPVLAASGTGQTTIVDATGASAASGAAIIAQSQKLTGSTTAGNRNPDTSGFLLYVGHADGSVVAADANDLSAKATGNQLDTVLSVEGPPVAGLGPVAAALSSQAIDGRVLSRINGRSEVHVAGAALASTLSASKNNVEAGATGNIAKTVMTVRAPDITTFGLPGSGPVGTAMVGDDEMRSTSASFAAQTDQVAGAHPVAATIVGSAAQIDVEGTIAGSALAASGNGQSAQARTNMATTDLALETATFMSSADLLMVQSSDANVRAMVGDPENRGGVSIVPTSAITGSQLSIRENRLQTLALGNRGINRLSLEAAGVADGGGHGQSVAGGLGAGFGASATFALSSTQKVGMTGAEPEIESLADGRFAVTGNGSVSGSTIDVEDNRQSAGAAANSIDNDLSLSAASLGDAGAALSASQFGAAKVTATSTMRAVAPGSSEDSDVRITGNTNQASAAMNEAANRLMTATRASDIAPLAEMTSDNLGGAQAEASQVLNNTQFAMGAITATASTLLAGSTSNDSIQPGLVGSSFRILGNTAQADAAGNRATNIVDLGGSGSGGIVSSQMNVAGIAATSQVNALLSAPRPDQRIDRATVAIDENRNSSLARGNFVENDLTVDRQTGTAIGQVLNAQSHATAPAALVSTQSNLGAVTAMTSTKFAVPLNGWSIPATDARFSMTGNTTTATAYANGALNSVSLAPYVARNGIAVVNSQSNSGPVMAWAMTGSVNFSMGDIRRSNLSISNNSVTAAATGNVATNLIGTLH